MNDLTRLLAVEGIKSLKARYFRSLDTKDWAALAGVFSPDAVLDLREVTSVRDPSGGQYHLPIDESRIYAGRDAIVGMIRGVLEHVLSVHHGHMPEIEILSETSARAIWAMQDFVHDPRRQGGADFIGYGHYHDEYERMPTGWVIKRSRITRLYVSNASF